LDQEEICRTPTIERTLTPFFGEEHQFKIPRRFRYLSIYLWDRDMKQDKPIGKIAIKREELHMYNHKDHWFSLRPVDQDSEVQGMANVEVTFAEAPHTQSLSESIDLGQHTMAHHQHLSHHQQHSHQQRAHLNDYKENSELSNIQRAAASSSAAMTLKTRAAGLFGHVHHPPSQTQHFPTINTTSTSSDQLANWKSHGRFVGVTIKVPLWGLVRFQGSRRLEISPLSLPFHSFLPSAKEIMEISGI